MPLRPERFLVELEPSTLELEVGGILTESVPTHLALEPDFLLETRPSPLELAEDFLLGPRPRPSPPVLVAGDILTGSEPTLFVNFLFELKLKPSPLELTLGAGIVQVVLVEVVLADWVTWCGSGVGFINEDVPVITGVGAASLEGVWRDTLPLVMVLSFALPAAVSSIMFIMSFTVALL